jgi:hypothetical protein
MARTISRSLLALVALAWAVPAWSAEATSASDKPKVDFAEMMKKMTEAGTPGAEHKLLDPLVGKWSYKLKCEMVPGQPMELTGTCERKWILGGRFVEEKYTGQGFGGTDFEGCGIIGYDKAKKKYNYGWISNMSTNIATTMGTYDPSTKTFTFEGECYCPIEEGEIKVREVIRMESNDKTVVESYQLRDGKETKMMEIVATRQK